MSDNLPSLIDPDAPIFVISSAAGLADMHPQTLRGYDRLGLVVPKRARGRGRRYSLRDIRTLRHIQRMSQDEGINLEGIRRILALEAALEESHEQVHDLLALLQELRNTPEVARLFTADRLGTVQMGRQRRRQLALPGA